MGLDRDRIERKSVYLLEQVRSLSDLSQKLTKEEILHDPWVFGGVKYALQTAIEALIDLAYHVSARKYAHAPADARDALQNLLDERVITPEDYQAYSAMVGLRNRLVHGYQEVDPERIYEIITARLGDLERFVQQVTGLLRE